MFTDARQVPVRSTHRCEVPAVKELGDPDLGYRVVCPSINDTPRLILEKNNEGSGRRNCLLPIKVSVLAWRQAGTDGPPVANMVIFQVASTWWATSIALSFASSFLIKTKARVGLPSP